jgi:LPXTG-motif cell wall-anchored protein
MPALAVVAVLALGGAVWVLRKRRRVTCVTPAGPVDLGRPAPRSRATAGTSNDAPVDTF